MGKIRDIRFDVLKGALILSVVLGHFFTHNTTHDIISETLANVIYSFHMPLFVFVSGYFTKKSGIAQGNLRILETYIVYQLIKGLAYRYSPLQLMILPGPMLWYLVSLIIWRFLFWGLDKIGVTITWRLIAILVAMGVTAGFFPWIGREFALSRTIVFAPYFFLGVLSQRIPLLNVINERISNRLSLVIWIIVFAMSFLFAYFSIDVRSLFAGTYPYPDDCKWIYAFARLLSYLSSVVISVVFIKVFSFENSVLGTIGRDSLKYYMFHGLILMVIDYVGLPWASYYSVLYALIVSTIIFFFNKTKLSDYAIRPLSFILKSFKYGKPSNDNN